MSFCETVKLTHNVIEVEVISKYGEPVVKHMDVKILETLQNGVSVDSLTITTYAIACHYPLGEFTIGDTLLVAFSNFSSPTGSENHDAIEFSLCRRNFLKMAQNEISGFISPSLSSQNHDDFKNNLTACNDFIATNENLESLEKFISISPNPFSENLKINLGAINTSEISIDIFSNAGHLIFSKNDFQNSNFELPLNNSPKGIYFIRIRYGKKNILKKMVRM